MNIVMTGSGQYVELQGTGEEATFTEEQLHELLALAKKGINELIDYQKQVIGTVKLSGEAGEPEERG